MSGAIAIARSPRLEIDAARAPCSTSARDTADRPSALAWAPASHAPSAMRSRPRRWAALISGATSAPPSAADQIAARSARLGMPTATASTGTYSSAVSSSAPSRHRMAPGMCASRSGSSRAVGGLQRADAVDHELAILQRGGEDGVARQRRIGEVRAGEAEQAAAGRHGDRQRGVGPVHRERGARRRRLLEQAGDPLHRGLAAEGQRRRRHAAQAPTARGIVDHGAEQDAGEPVAEDQRPVGERDPVVGARSRRPHRAETAQPFVRAQRDEHVRGRYAAARQQARGRARRRGAAGRRGREPAERGAQLRRQLAQRDGGEDRALELVEAEAVAGQREAVLDAGDAAVGAQRHVEVRQSRVALGDRRRALGDGRQRHVPAGCLGLVGKLRRRVGRGRRIVHPTITAVARPRGKGRTGARSGQVGRDARAASHLAARSYMDSVAPGTETASMSSELHEVVAALPLAELRIVEHESAVAAFVGLAPAGPLDRAVRVESFEEFSATFGDPAQPLPGPYIEPAPSSRTPCAASFATAGTCAGSCARQACRGPPTRTVISTPAPGCACSPRSTSRRSSRRPTRTAWPAAARERGARPARARAHLRARRRAHRARRSPRPAWTRRHALAWRAGSHIDTPSAAAYYPWVVVSDPATGASTEAPPSGHAAGLWSRVDERMGPHHAPTAEVVLATDGPVGDLSASEQHQLNRAGVNCLRAWPGPELRAWGACTMSSDPELRYLHRQRIVGHLAASIAQGTRWAAEEPNDASLHDRLRTVIGAFLNQAWRAGALQGDAPAQAYFVRCDDELNDEQARAGGDVIVEIGLSVRRAGDFRVLRIAHHDLPA